MKSTTIEFVQWLKRSTRWNEWRIREKWRRRRKAPKSKREENLSGRSNFDDFIEFLVKRIVSFNWVLFRNENFPLFISRLWIIWFTNELFFSLRMFSFRNLIVRWFFPCKCFLTENASETRFIAFEIQRTNARTASLVKHFLRLGAVFQPRPDAFQLKLKNLKRNNVNSSQVRTQPSSMSCGDGLGPLQNELNFYLERWKSDLNKWTIDQKSCIYITELYQLEMFSHSKRNVFWIFTSLEFISAVTFLSMQNTQWFV